MLKDIYIVDELKLSKYKIQDEKERYFTLKDSIKTLREWFQFYETDDLSYLNRNWIVETQDNWEKGKEYCFKVSNKNSMRQIGEVRINHINYSHNFANITFITRTGEEGIGVITKAVKKIIDICFSNLHLNRVELYMSVNNHASKKIAEKVGAKLEGIMRNRVVRKNKIEDAYLYSIIKGDI